MGKCRSLRTARKLHSHRRDQKWHDKQYKKAHLGTALKANPFGGASHAKGIVLEKVGVEAKQPNSAIRKKMIKFWLLDLVAKVMLLVTFLESALKVVKVANVSLLALYKGKKERPRS
eukprot:bmy_09170T0